MPDIFKVPYSVGSKKNYFRTLISLFLCLLFCLLHSREAVLQASTGTRCDLLQTDGPDHRTVFNCLWRAEWFNERKAFLLLRIFNRTNPYLKQTFLPIPSFFKKKKNLFFCIGGFPGGSDGKEFDCNAGDLASIPGSGRSPGEGNGNPLQYAWRIPWTEEAGRLQSTGHKELDTTEWLAHSRLTNNVVIVPGEQRSYSAIHMHVSIPRQTPLPSRLPHNIEHSFIPFCLWLSEALLFCFESWSLLTELRASKIHYFMLSA